MSAKVNNLNVNADGLSVDAIQADKKKKNEVKGTEHNVNHKLVYGVTDNPPWLTAILFGLQQIIICSSGLIAEPLVVADLLCARNNAMIRVKMVGTSMVICGIGTFVQTTFGIRLPLLQGPSFAFLPPILAMMQLPEYKCPSDLESFTNTSAGILVHKDEIFDSRMQVVQGALLAAAAVEMLIGMTGLIGLITRFVGPMTIVPLMICLELSATRFCIDYSSKHWISIVVVIILLITALYLHAIKVPIPTYNRTDKCHFVKFPIFGVFPYLIAILSVWIVCIILTATGVFAGEKHEAVRTDTRSYVIWDSPWFRVPYPAQWGPLGFNFGVFLGFVAATLASITESIGDYYACARACNQPRPPSHAANRGIMMEGLACFVGALLGSGASVTSYSEVIGVIGITKVACRLTMQIAGICFVIFGILTKFGAVLATIPDPIVGGILMVSIATVGGVGLASLQAVDLKLSRNLAILGFAIFAGAMIPTVVYENPFNTGFKTFDQLLNILCSIQMFVGGMVGFILDNTVPGATREQRGFLAKRHEWDDLEQDDTTSQAQSPQDIYAFGPKATRILGKIPLTRFMPFLPPRETIPANQSNGLLFKAVEIIDQCDTEIV